LNGDGRTVSLQANGTNIASNIAITNTGGWQAWTDIKVTDIQLEAGIQTLRLTFGATDYVNLNYITFVPKNGTDTPSITINTPANWSEFTLGETVTFNIDATSTNATIIKVEVFNSNVLLGSDNTAPYSIDWIPTTAGTHTISIIATDNNNVIQTALINLIINEAPKTISLKTGWNLIGCPIAGSTDLDKALSSIWSNVEVVKDFDGFWKDTNDSALNSLDKLDWGKGYMIKVKTNCDLDWSIK